MKAPKAARGSTYAVIGIILGFVAGFMLSATTVGASLSTLGSAAKKLSPEIRLAAASAALAGLAFTQSVRSRTLAPGIRRQTPRIWLFRYGRLAYPMWGLDAGLIFTTFRISLLSWAAALLGILGFAPWYVGLVYAVGFLLPFLTALLVQTGGRRKSQTDELLWILDWFDRRTRTARLGAELLL